ncbi:ADP-ribosylglycohydrolase [Bifidobacterium sp. DSM 109957]|uniref:ADP-ribosylglycohydrolase n=2 Tax=Bifidobacterium oedipodis TaxID=2675322 RepID=A0A7Y0ESE2_9BIFI|nr:ADP-ribosylglycohydrolase [Bifidobacterium sp. DSM 109957]
MGIERLMTTTLEQRAIGALTGLAIGDALGMPTQSMSPRDIAHYYGGPITCLVDAVPEQPIAPSMKAGAVTDDTEQAFLLAQRLIADRGDLDNNAYAHDLLAWEDAMRAKGSLDLLGPSTKAALKALAEGVSPELTGRFGTTNGGAMRATPVGIAFAPGASLAQEARRSCYVTHNTTQGIEGTMLVAAAVSYALEGDANPLQSAISFVNDHPAQGYWSAKASVLVRTERLMDWLDSKGRHVDDERFAHMLRYEIGTSVEANESVPCAFAIAARFATDPMRALCFAASLGGDTDTMAAMAGAMLGAQYGSDAFDQAIAAQVLRQLQQDNGLDPAPVAQALCALRSAHIGSASSASQDSE